MKDREQSIVVKPVFGAGRQTFLDASFEAAEHAPPANIVAWVANAFPRAS